MTKKRLALLATAIAMVAAMALPSVAIAAPEMDFTFLLPVKATGATFTTTLTTRGGSQVTCSASDETVEWTSKTGGNQHVLLTGCSSSGFACTGKNAKGESLPSGQITMSDPFDLVYIKGFTHTAGLLVTPPAGGTFADFNCTLLVHVKVTGNGLIGHVDGPECGERSVWVSTSYTQSLGGLQTYQEIAGSFTRYHLEAAFNGGTPEESSLVRSGTVTLEGEGTLTCN